MRHIYVIRHGSYDRRTGNLTEQGITQANKLAQIIQAENPQITSSPAKRAQQTAELLAQKLKCHIDTHEALGEQNMPVEDRVEAISQIVKNAKPELMLITHAGIVADYGTHLLKELGARKTQTLETVMPGEGLHYDIPRRKYLLIPSDTEFATNL